MSLPIQKISLQTIVYKIRTQYCIFTLQIIFLTEFNWFNQVGFSQWYADYDSIIMNNEL